MPASPCSPLIHRRCRPHWWPATSPTTGAAAPSSTGSRSPSDRRAASGSIGPNGVGKSTLLQVLAGRPRPRCGRGRPRPARRRPSATWPRSTRSSAGETVRQALTRRTGARERRGRAGRGGRRAGRAGTGRRARATRSALERFNCLGVGRPRRPDRRASSTSSGSGRGWPTGRWPPCRVARGQGGPGRHRALPVRHHPAGRADQRPRLRRPAPARAWVRSTSGRHGHRLPRPGLPRAHGDHRARARRPQPDRPPSTAADGAATRRSGPTPGATPPRPTSVYDRRRAAAGGPGRAAAPVGHHRGPPGDPAPPGQRQGPARLPDQPHREAGVQGPPDRAGPGRPRRGGEALRGMGPPVHHRGGATGRRGGGPADRGGDRAGLVPDGPARPRDRLGRAGGPDRGQRDR